MTGRKKLPAYGAGLLDRRRRGDHPLCVHLVAGNGWRQPTPCALEDLIPGAHPLIAIKPADYEPGRYDFALVAYVRVLVFDQCGSAAAYENPDFGPARTDRYRFWGLIGELAAVAADVEIASPAFDCVRAASDLALTMRCPGAFRDAGRNYGWPHWWSASLDREHAKRRDTWLRAVGELRQRAELVGA